MPAFPREDGDWTLPTAARNGANGSSRDGATLLCDCRGTMRLDDVRPGEPVHTDLCRSQLDRLLDPDNTAVTLESLERLAHAVGRQLRLELT